MYVHGLPGTFVRIESILEPAFFQFNFSLELRACLSSRRCSLRTHDSTHFRLITTNEYYCLSHQDDGRSIKTQRESRRQDARGVFQMRLGLDGGYKKASHGLVLSES